MRSRTQATFAFWMVGVLLLAGCGGAGDRPELGTVTGTVTLDGKPLEGATVIFQPEGTRSSTGVTDSSGRYELKFVRDIKGAAVGTHKVSISKPSEDESSDLVPAAYNAETSLTAEVKAGANTFDFDVKSSSSGAAGAPSTRTADGP